MTDSDTPRARQELRRLELIASWLDRRYLDPIFGMIFPGAADTLFTLVGIYGVFVAVRQRAHPVLIARMLLNLALDAFISAIPVVGWIADFFFRAHSRNLALLQQRGPAVKPSPRDWLVVLGAATLFVLALLTPILLLLVAGAAIVRQFG